MSYATICYLVALTLAGSDRVPHNYSALELAEANQSALELVREIDLEIEFDNKAYFYGGKQLVQSSHWKRRWSKRGDLERLRYETVFPGKSDRQPQNLSDWLDDRSCTKVLRNWDPKNPQRITPIHQGTVKAHILPRTRAANPLEVTRYLLWSFWQDVDDRRSLLDLVRESPKVEELGRTMLDDHEVWHLRIQHPGVSGEARPKSWFEVFVEPAANFAVRRVVESQPMQQQINGKMESFTVKTVRTVKDFANKRDGVFVPIKIASRTEAQTPDSRLEVCTITVKNLVVNEPLPADALDFKFPEHVQVVDAREGTITKHKVQLWGPDDKPVQEITQLSDLPGFVGFHENTPGKGDNTEVGSSRTHWLIWGNIVGLLLAVPLLFFFLWKRSRG